MGIPIFHCHLLLVLPSKLQDLQGNQCLVAIENAGKPMSAMWALAVSNGSPQKCDQIRGLVHWPVLFATRMFIRLGCLAAWGGTWRNMKEHKGTQGDMKLQPLSCGGCSSSFRIEIYIYIHTFINTHMHSYIYIYVYLCVCVYIHLAGRTA